MEHGLNGWFGKLLKGIIKGVAVSIAGAIHPAVGLAMAAPINNMFNNWLDGDFWNTQSGLSSQNIGLNKSNVAISIQDEEGAEQLYNWVKNRITESWINNFFSDLNGSSTNYHLTKDFRNKVNHILLQLEALRLYYKGNQLKPKSINGFDLGIDDIIDNKEFKSKSELFSIMSTALRVGYKNALKNSNINLKTKTLKGFKANQYNLQGKAPDSINFDFLAFDDIELFVFADWEDVTVTYLDGTTATTSDNSYTTPPIIADGPTIIADPSNDTTIVDNPFEVDTYDPSTTIRVNPNENIGTIKPSVMTAGLGGKALLVVATLIVVGTIYNKNKNKK